MNESQNEINLSPINIASPNILLDGVVLGDVIRIHAPRNKAIDEQTYYVYYVDELKLKLLNTTTNQLLKLSIDGYVADESIDRVDLLSRSDAVGFAKQHKLQPPQWIDVHFGGDMPAVISGEITNLEEDMIEITTYPGMRVIYVDFAYQGIPEDLPIDKIVLRERPNALNTSLRSMMDGVTEIGREEAEAEATVEYDEDDGQMIVNVPENVLLNPTPEDIIAEYIDQDAAVISGDGEDDDGELASLRQFFEVPESERRYSEEMQVSDLLGELISKLPLDKRTDKALKDAHQFVTRFKELRREFSVFDYNGDVIDTKTTGILHKPLIDHIVKMDKDIKWLLPVVCERNELMAVTAERSADNYNGASTHLETEMSSFTDALKSAENAFSASGQGDVNQYDQMLDKMDALCSPADSSTDSALIVDDVFLGKRETRSSLECVVSNDSDFQMDVSVSNQGSSHETAKNRFTVRRYTTASSRMVLDETTRRKMYERKLVGKSDRANIRSIIMLPRPVLFQSQHSSPSANLYLKSKLASIPVYKFKMLKPKTNIFQREIDDLDKEIEYEDAVQALVNKKKRPTDSPAKKSVVGEPFLKVPTHYSVSNDIVERFPKNEEIFRRFLNSVLPRTRTLIRWLRPSIEHLYSFVDVVAALEPFFVESEDVTFKQYIEIRYYIKEKIKKYAARVAQNKLDLDVFKDTAEMSDIPKNRIRTILGEQKEFEQYLLSTYHLDDNASSENPGSIFSSETLQNLLQTDGAAAYSAILNLYLIQYLTIPESVVGILKPPTISSEDTKSILKSKCDRRFLTKKYHSVAALRKDDNTKDVFYDKEYDDTPYHLVDKYKDEKKRFKTDDEFLEFFVETLIQKHDCPPHLASTLANTILSKKKRIQTGEYAMLEIRPTLADKLREEDLPDGEKREVEQESDMRKRVEFYKRVRDAWELDKTVGLEAFIDTNTLFCELSESCNKLTDVNQCVPGEMAALQMRLSKRARMMEEFQDRVARSFDEVAEELRQGLSRARKQLRRDVAVKKTKLYRQNNYSYELGKYAKSTELITKSPHEDLRERILGWPDFVAKQKMIFMFVQRFCREPMQQLEEDQHWMYCKDTNTRLFPMSIFRLARAFMMDKYTEMLDQILRENGEMSDDGDSIVDKYTGYPLRKIDYSAEEGFDESGFRITTNAIVEERDIGATVTNILESADRVSDDPTTQAIYNVFRTLITNMGIEKDDQLEEFVLRVAREQMNNADVVMPEKEYNALLAEEAAVKQTKKIARMPFTTYFNQLLVIIVSCATFVAMQTRIPSVKTKKTFPGCVKSFAGYPLDAGNKENAPGLKYVVCVLDKSKRASAQPWISIEPLSVDKLLTRMKVAMESVCERADVKKLYETKLTHLARYPDENVPEEVGIQRWTHFLPPVVPFAFDSGKLPAGISEEYEKELFHTIIQGSTEQFKMLGLIKGKLLKHGYLVYDVINRIVKNKQLLLASAGGATFLENACCNEEGSMTNPIAYFSKEIPELENVIKKARRMESALFKVRNLSKARTFFDPNSSRIIGAAVPDTIISRTIYEAFIHYCNFDTDAPIPAHLLAVAATKPEYNRYASIDDKIAFMKKHGKNYGVDDFHSLMRIVNGRNMVNLIVDKEIAALGAWKDVLDYFDEKDSHLVEARLRDLLRRTVDEYDPRSAVHEERATNRTLNRYLQRANEKMREVIVGFLDTHGNFTSAKLNAMTRFLETCASWRIDDIKSACQETRNMVYNMAKVYPNKTIRNYFKVDLPKHWGFAPEHFKKLDAATNEFYKEIEAMADSDSESTFNQYLKRATMNLADLALFVEHIPQFAAFVREDTSFWSLYSDETVTLLHQYGVLSTIHEYAVLSNDREFVHMRAEEIKTSRRRRIGDVISNELDEDAEDYGAERTIRQVHIVESDSLELKKIAAKWLTAILAREMTTKDAIDRDYREIMDGTMNLKFKDKKRITDYLGGLTRDERRVEQNLRSHKIGRWNVGMQKGLYQYDSGVYQMEEAQWKEGEGGIIYTVPLEGGGEVEDLERAEQQGQSADYDQGDGWANLDEDYTDGVYYEEDAEREEYDE